MADRALSILRNSIITAEIPAGERLLIDDLAHALGMSPMPIREALRELASIGLVELIPHKGARVADISLPELTQIYEARLALEPLAVESAATRFTAADAESASSWLAKYEAACRDESVGEVSTADAEFHFTLYAASGSSWLIRLITPLWQSSERYLFRWLPLGAASPRREDEHVRILEACIAHDPGRASRELHDHLASTANFVARRMGSRTDPFELKGEG